VRKLVAAVVGTIAVFVMLFGLGMSSWAIVALGAAMLALAIGLALINVVRRGGRAWVAGTAHVVSASEPPASSDYGRCELQIVVAAPGLPASAVKVRDPRVPVVKWPDAGATLPVMVAVDDMRHVRIQWDEVMTHTEAMEEPQAYVDPLRDLPVDDLLPEPEAPPWVTRDRQQWRPGADPTDPTVTADLSGQLGDLRERTATVRENPGGPIVLEGTLVDADSRPTTLPRRPRPSPRPRPAAENAEAAAAAAAPPGPSGPASSGSASSAPASSGPASPDPDAATTGPATPMEHTHVPDDLSSLDPEHTRRTDRIDRTADESAAVAPAAAGTGPVGSDAAPGPVASDAAPGPVASAAASGPVAGEHGPDPEVDIALDGDDHPGPVAASATPEVTRPVISGMDTPAPEAPASDEPTAEASASDSPAAEAAEPETKAAAAPAGSVAAGSVAAASDTAGSDGPAAPTDAATARDTDTDADEAADNRIDELMTAYPSARPGPAGAIHGVGITVLVTDLQRSTAFYRNMLGFFEIDSGGGSSVLASGDTRLVLRAVHELGPATGRLIYLNLEVGDVDAVHEELRGKGVQFVHGPRAVNRGDRLELWAASFHDPDGHNIAVTQWRAVN
jgi:catechol 2,3-dioxygenase-like lactoylglutathione lyase family enzyme